MADPPSAQPIVHSLALALIASSEAPIVLLDGNLDVVAASASFSTAFHVNPGDLAGRSLFSLGGGEWDVPQLRSLLKATLAGADIEPYEMDLAPAGQGVRRLVVTAHVLVHDDPTTVRLLLAITDVTDAQMAERLKDDLLHEKAILFQELQHRVANSLQIIASVLMQSARRMPMEARSYLVDAHSRVMSVAALQHQLSASGGGDVELKAYFTELCDSIAASMIPDRDRLKLTVVAEKCFASADVSVSLGLVVTELVINALKHAFPGATTGEIVVTYEGRDDAWTLSVGDNGSGMPSGKQPAKGGLGSSIVQALAKQLGAEVRVMDNHPGALIRLVHAP